MRKDFYLLIALLSIAFSAFGQNVLTYESNAYLSGDKQHYILAQNLNEVYEGSGGYNVLWDYSYLTGGDSLTSYLLDATKQEGHEYFPESNVAIKENDKVAFYHVGPQGMEDYGFVRLNSIYKYDSPIRRFSFPFVFGKKIEGEYTSEKLGSPDTKSTGVYNSEIDGFGKLILPGDIVIENVLRVRTSQINDTTEIGYVAYRWYMQNSDPILRYPLLSIITSESATNYCVRKAAYYANANQLVDQEPSQIGFTTPQEFTTPEALMLKIKVYPNPFIEKAIVDYMLPTDAKVTIIVSDGLGRPVDTLVDKRQKAGSYSVEFKGKGYYFVYYITTLINGRVVSSKKLFHVNR